MKQRYAFIIFFIMLFMYHRAQSCATCITYESTNPMLWENAIYEPTELNNVTDQFAYTDAASTGIA